MELQGDLFENHAVNELTKELGPGFDLILTNNRRIIVSVDRNHSPARARVSRLFSMADSETIRQLSRYIIIGGKLPVAVKSFIHEKAHALAPRKKGKGKLHTKGVVYNLKDMADKVWREYFSGPMSTRITWGSWPTRTKKRARRKSIRYGTYDRDLDLVTIHPALDCPHIPQAFVEYVVYHELLHKIVPPTVGPDGAVRFHTKEFKAMEKKFDGYKKLMEWQKAHVWKALGKAPVCG